MLIMFRKTLQPHVKRVQNTSTGNGFKSLKSCKCHLDWKKVAFRDHSSTVANSDSSQSIICLMYAEIQLRSLS